MSKLNERRIARASFRANEYGSGARKLSGYAATFGTVTRIGGGQDSFHEVLSRASFTDALKKSDVRALVNHDPNQLLARSTAGTLRLAEDNKGLRFEIDLPNTTLAKDLYELVRTGAMDECSFAFRVAPGGDTYTDYDCTDATCCGTRGSVLRTINKVDELFDVSTVTYPAYSGTNVGLMEDLSKKSKIGQPDDQDAGELDGTNVKSGDKPKDDDEDDEDFDPTDYLSAVVPAEVRARVRAHRRHIATGDPDAAWFADASRRLDAADLDRADASRRQRAAAAGVLIENDSLRAAEDEHESRIAEEDAIRATKRNVQLIRQPSTFKGTGQEYLEWLDKFMKGFGN